ncbi:hypothetical protein M153_8400002537 [Pseudoloma neurophilia]|uniref:Uncharacterized protein n=1 Tax=Pseudoloma neurophilia TaxID=146866 RepID=A0A0R0LVU9_9MICR|nr:hypothetical protein M153_8400002537 [Pseudoloma neurophilia]
MLFFCSKCQIENDLFIGECLHIFCYTCRVQKHSNDICIYCKKETTFHNLNTEIKDQLSMNFSDMVQVLNFQINQFKIRNKILNSKLETYKKMLGKCKKEIIRLKGEKSDKLSTLFRNKRENTDFNNEMTSLKGYSTELRRKKPVERSFSPTEMISLRKTDLLFSNKKYFTSQKKTKSNYLRNLCEDSGRVSMSRVSMGIVSRKRFR